MHTLYSDGGSRGNPGAAAWSFVLLDAQGKIQDIDAKYVGTNTNNFAEYSGLLEGLKAAIKLGVSDLTCYLDSELVVMQVNGAYQVKQDTLKLLNNQIQSCKLKFTKIVFAHVPRAENKVADRLVNIALDAVDAVEAA